MIDNERLYFEVLDDNPELAAGIKFELDIERGKGET